MGDVLSQNEIDQLLNALSTGELDAEDVKEADTRQVKNYDFARPAKFSKEHLRTLEIIHEHFARMLSTELSVQFRKPVQIEVVNSEAVIYSEFANALSNPVILGVVGVSPLKGSLIVELASNIGYAFVDRMLGGPGVSLARVREFSEIEINILERILAISTGFFTESWKSVIDIHPILEKVETNSQYAQIISPSEMIAIITMNVNMGTVEGLMNICIPYITIEKVIDRLNTKYWFSTMQEKDGTSYQEAIESLIAKSPVPIRAVLGKSAITVLEFSNLQLGDIIRVNRKVDEELSVYVGNIKKFTALPGASGDRYAVRVTSILREEQ